MNIQAIYMHNLKVSAICGGFRRVVGASMIGVVACAGLATSAMAGSVPKISVLFQDFPKGTTCNVSGAVGKVRLNVKRGHPQVAIKGSPSVGRLYCQLPDGRTVYTDINKRLPAGNRTSGVTIYPDGRAYMTTSANGQLMQYQFSNALQNN